jgi:hypothetical protein
MDQYRSASSRRDRSSLIAATSMPWACSMNSGCCQRAASGPCRRVLSRTRSSFLRGEIRHRCRAHQTFAKAVPHGAALVPQCGCDLRSAARDCGRAPRLHTSAHWIAGADRANGRCLVGDAESPKRRRRRVRRQSPKRVLRAGLELVRRTKSPSLVLRHTFWRCQSSGRFVCLA